MLHEQITARKEKIAVVGLGYVGLPLAVAFAKIADVVGFDINEKKVQLYRDGRDATQEVGDAAVQECTALFTSQEKYLRECKFHIIAVPTPINSDKTPNLRPVIEASRTVGKNLTRGSIVVFESTVYPGVTEDVCVPIVEATANLKCGRDFKVGYSPERINPGDSAHRLETITKIVSGMDEETLTNIAKVYEMIIRAGVYKAESIKVAEAAKVIENAQRDINIAFMNELSVVFNKMGINTQAVLQAARTKWNFLNFTPGLVGGHCIGVDPYYFIYKAEELGYHSQIILAGRRINDEMGNYVAQNTVKKLIQAGVQVNGARVAIFGITFKENCPDCRNTRVIDIIRALEEYNVRVEVVDPSANAEEVWHEYGVRLSGCDDIRGIDAAIFAVAHREFTRLALADIKKMFAAAGNPIPANAGEGRTEEESGQRKRRPVLIDVKGLFDRREAEAMGFAYWSL